MKRAIVPESAAEAQLEQLLALVSPRVGIIRSLALRVRSDDEPRVPLIYDAVLANYDFRKAAAIERGSCGKGFTAVDAILGAIGEGVEHYCASHPATRRMRRAAMDRLEGGAIAPPEFVLYSDAQYASKDFPLARWTKDAEIPWIKAVELGTGEHCWIPATLAYLNYSGEQPQDALCPPTSSGMAAGPTFAHATRSAILELIEREAFVVTWMNRLPSAEIAIGMLPEELQAIGKDFSMLGARIRLFLLPTDMPAWVVLGIALGECKTTPAAIVGLGCALDIETAARKALFEVCQVYEPLARKFARGEADGIEKYEDVHTLEQHAAYFLRHDHLHELDFLLGSGRTVDIGALQDYTREGVAQESAALVDAISAAGERAVAIDVTTPDLTDFPIRVARVLVTGMQPIHFDHAGARFGGRRLFELPVALGLIGQPHDEATLNACPHPLA